MAAGADTATAPADPGAPPSAAVIDIQPAATTECRGACVPRLTLPFDNLELWAPASAAAARARGKLMSSFLPVAGAPKEIQILHGISGEVRARPRGALCRPSGRGHTVLHAWPRP